MQKDSTSTLVRSVRHFFSGTIASRISGLARDISMAYAFGTQEGVAAFLMAFRFSHLLRRVLGEGAMQSAFIPVFEKLKHENPERANSFFIDLILALCCLLLLIIVVGMVGCGLCLGFDWVDEGNRHILTYTMIMLPSLFFICLFGLNAALLQCNNNYFLPSISPVIFNLLWIVGAVAFAHYPIGEAMYWLSVVIILASAFQWALTIPSTLALLGKPSFKSVWSKATLFSPDIRRLAGPLTMAVIGISASQINNALDVIFARFASFEGPAYLWYAIRIQQLPLALFGIALSAALLPPLTRALKNNNTELFHHLLNFSLRRSFALMLPMTAGIFLLGGASIELLYGYGDFQLESIEGTTSCLWGYGIGLVPMTWVLIVAPAFYARENFRTPTLASIATMAINILFNTWFIFGLKMGPSSVAWATSTSAAVNVLILAYALKEHTLPILNTTFLKSVGKTTLATAMGSAGISLTAPFLSHSTAIETAVYLVAETIIFSGFFFATAYAVKAQDIFWFEFKKKN